MRIRTFFDPDFGAIAFVEDEGGNVIATGSAGISHASQTEVVTCADPWIPASVWNAAIL